MSQENENWLQTPVRPTQFLSAFIPPLHSTAMNKPLLLAVFWGKWFVLLCIGGSGYNKIQLTFETGQKNASADPPDSPTNMVCSVSSITALATPMAFLILRRLATAPTSIVSLVKGKYALLLNRERESYGVWDSPWSKGDARFMNTSHACMFPYVSCIFLRSGKHIYFNAHYIESVGEP